MRKPSGKLKRGLFERLSRYCRFTYLKILRIDDPPERIAMGAALGAFIGIMPTLGIAIILCIVGAFIFKLNKASTILGSFIMNPFTTPFFWSLSMSVGGLIFWKDTASLFAHGSVTEAITSEIGTVSLIFVTGNTVVATIFAAGVYVGVKSTITKRRAKKAAKRAAKLSVAGSDQSHAA